MVFFFLIGQTNLNYCIFRNDSEQKNGNRSDIDNNNYLHSKPKIPVRRKKLLVDKYIENHTDSPGSFLCISKIKKDFENTLRQKTILNNIQMPKNERINGHRQKSPTKEGNIYFFKAQNTSIYFC